MLVRLRSPGGPQDPKAARTKGASEASSRTSKASPDAFKIEEAAAALRGIADCHALGARLPASAADFQQARTALGQPTMT
jgi:hypothetical protein